MLLDDLSFGEVTIVCLVTCLGSAAQQHATATAHLKKSGPTEVTEGVRCQRQGIYMLCYVVLGCRAAPIMNLWGSLTECRVYFRASLRWVSNRLSSQECHNQKRIADDVHLFGKAKFLRPEKLCLVPLQAFQSKKASQPTSCAPPVDGKVLPLYRWMTGALSRHWSSHHVVVAEVV